MHIGLFAFGKLDNSFGGQVKLIYDQLISYNHKVTFLSVKRKYSFIDILFSFCGLFRGLQFTGFGYKLISNSNINFNYLISFQNIIPWSLYRLIKNKNIKIIYWIDMSIKDNINIYVRQKYFGYLINKFYQYQIKNINRNILVTNKFLFKRYNYEVIQRIVDPVFYNKNNEIFPFSPILVLIGNDFERKQFKDIINICTEIFDISGKSLETLIFGNGNPKIFSNYKNVSVYKNYNKKQIVSKIMNINKNIFTISISRNEGAPISLLEVQAMGGISLCTNSNGGNEYVPNENRFGTINELKVLIKKNIINKNLFKINKIKCQQKVQTNKPKNITKKILKYLD